MRIKQPWPFRSRQEEERDKDQDEAPASEATASPVALLQESSQGLPAWANAPVYQTTTATGATWPPAPEEAEAQRDFIPIVCPHCSEYEYVQLEAHVTVVRSWSVADVQQLWLRDEDDNVLLDGNGRKVPAGIIPRVHVGGEDLDEVGVEHEQFYCGNCEYNWTFDHEPISWI